MLLPLSNKVCQRLPVESSQGNPVQVSLSSFRHNNIYPLHRIPFPEDLAHVQILSRENGVSSMRLQLYLSRKQIGEVIGQVNGDKVVFVKKMPIMTLLVNKKGTRKTYNKKHRPIYYTGEFSSDKQSVTGTWRFKLGFIWLGINSCPGPTVKRYLVNDF